ncbi:unnamed protein product [Prorocentrum cordatum]|uniref:Uncharacterized protein n=1 Tax=Prorocentrum cordatum TaxID=2364126 RepID=A0ABN9S0C3_9DINO|nr:unnamed protein product [Polarella glacialis]
MPPKGKRKYVDDDDQQPQLICGPAATAGPIAVQKGAGKGTYQIGPKQEFGVPPSAADGKPPKKKPRIGCGICGEKNDDMATACKCGKCSGTHKFAFPFWDWDTLTDQYHSNEKVKAGFDNAHQILQKQGGVKPEMETQETVGEKSGLFEDTIWSFRCLKESDVVDIYKKQPSEIDMKPTSVVDQSGALRNLYVQVNPEQPHTVVNIYRRRELNHSMLAMPASKKLFPQQGSMQMQSMVENRCMDLKAFFNAPTHESILTGMQDKATAEEIQARNEALKARSSGSAPSGSQLSAPTLEPLAAQAAAPAVAAPTEAASGANMGSMGPPATTPVKMNASLLSQLDAAASPGSGSAVPLSRSGAMSVVSSDKASSFEDGEGAESSGETDEETKQTKLGWTKLRHNCKIHKLLAGKKLGHTVRQLRDNVTKFKDDPDHSVASQWLDLAEKCKTAGDQKAKAIKTMNGEDLAQLADDIDKDVSRVPVVFQRALWERALEDWKSDQDWASKPGVAISMCLPWHREVGDVDDVTKFVCKAPTLSLMSVQVGEKASEFKDYICKILLPRFLNLGKNGHQKTLDFVTAAMGEIKAMPMTCEAEIDNAAAEVVTILQLMNTLGGLTEDTLNLAAVEQLGKAKATTVEGSVYGVLSNEPYWKVKLKDYLKYSPQVKLWRPAMAKHSAALQSEEPPTFQTLSGIIKDLPIIKSALPEVEYSSFFQVSRGALGRFFQHFAAHVKDNPHEATDEFSHNVETLSQKATSIFGFHPAWNDAVVSINSFRSQNNGKNLVENFCNKLGTFNLEMLVYAVAQFDKIEGLKDLAPEASMQKLVSFSKQAVELVTKQRSNTLEVSSDPLFDASLRWVLKASEWLQWSCVIPDGSGFKSFEQLLSRAKLAKSLAGAMTTILPQDADTVFLDDDAAAAADHSVGAFLGLLSQYEGVQDKSPHCEAAIVKGSFMESITPETAALKQLLFSAKRAATEKKLMTENESVPLSKLKAGALDKDWRDGISPSIAFDCLLESSKDFLNNMPYDLLKAEVESKIQLKNDFETLSTKFDIEVTASDGVTSALADLQRAAATVLEYAVLYGASKIRSNAVVLKKYLLKVQTDKDSWGVDKLFEPVQLALDKGIAMQSIM